MLKILGTLLESNTEEILTFRNALKFFDKGKVANIHMKVKGVCILIY